MSGVGNKTPYIEVQNLSYGKATETTIFLGSQP